MRISITLILLMLALIHALPLPGVLGGATLKQLYGMQHLDAATELLLRHRAVLFGGLALLAICAAFRPALRAAALWLNFLSVASFLLLATPFAALNPALRTVYIVDLLALGLLALAAVLHWRLKVATGSEPGPAAQA